MSEPQIDPTDLPSSLSQPPPPGDSPNMHQAFTRIIASTKQLPSPPEICLAVTRTVQDDQTTLDDMRQLVESDIALSAKLLQVANSAFFGVRERVTSVRRAISLLGFGTVKTLALGFFFNDEFGKLRLAGLPYPDLPRYALACSTVAESIAKEVASDITAEAGCLGLLHESGTIVMAMAFGNQYRRVLGELTQSGKPLWQAEETAFGLDHAMAGKLLLRSWRLSDSFVQAVSAHHAVKIEHNDDRQAQRLWKILSLAQAVALLFFNESQVAGTTRPCRWPSCTSAGTARSSAPSSARPPRCTGCGRRSSTSPASSPTPTARPPSTPRSRCATRPRPSWA